MAPQYLGHLSVDRGGNAGQNPFPGSRILPVSQGGLRAFRRERGGCFGGGAATGGLDGRGLSLTPESLEFERFEDRARGEVE